MSEDIDRDRRRLLKISALGATAGFSGEFALDGVRASTVPGDMTAKIADNGGDATGTVGVIDTDQSHEEFYNYERPAAAGDIPRSNDSVTICVHKARDGTHALGLVYTDRDPSIQDDVRQGDDVRSFISAPGEFIVKDGPNDIEGDDYGGSRARNSWFARWTDGYMYGTFSRDDIKDVSVTISDWNLLDASEIRVVGDDGEISRSIEKGSTVTFGTSSPERRIAEKFAPTFSFDEDEKFFPTDPTEFDSALYEVNGPNDYQGEEDFDDIFDIDPRESGYEPAEDIEEDEDNSYPRTELYGPDFLSEYVNSDENYTIFYNVTDALNEDETLYAVSYWQYYAFDQFVNVHWHDWEVLHVFFEGDVDEPEETVPVMAVASAHRGLAANNEYTGLDREEIGILSELGAHANATDFNSPDMTGPDKEFDRTGEVECTYPDRGSFPFSCDADRIDVTNIDDAYGLPRDERSGNSKGEIAVDDAYYRATIEGTPVQDLEVFEPSEISESDLIDVENDEDRQERTNGKTLTPDEYELTSMDRVINEIDEFTGPQFDIRVADDLSSRAPLPPSPVPGLGISDDFLDIIIALREGKGFKTVGEPWKQENFDDPTKVVCDTEYLTEDRGYTIDDVSEDPEGKVRGDIRDTVAGTEGTIPSERFGNETMSDDVMQEVVENANITYAPPSEEGIIVVNSEPRVGPTSNARVVVNDLELGEHKLIVDSPNRGPYSQSIQVNEGINLAGVDGRIPLAPDEELSKIVGTTSDEQTIANLTVSEDYLGTVYDAKPLSDDKFEVFIHHAGVYTVEITTEDGRVGAYRVNPEAGEETMIENLSTGKGVISQYLVSYLRDTAEESREIIDNENATNGEGRARGNGRSGIANSIASKFEAAADAAERAVEAIESGGGNNSRRADNQLNTVRNQLGAVENSLGAQRGKKVGEAEYLILIDRIEQARKKVNEATGAGAN